MTNNYMRFICSPIASGQLAENVLFSEKHGEMLLYKRNKGVLCICELVYMPTQNISGVAGKKVSFRFS